MDKEKELNELIALYAMRTRVNNDQDRGEELLRLFLKEYEQVKSVDLADVVGRSEQPEQGDGREVEVLWFNSDDFQTPIENPDASSIWVRKDVWEKNIQNKQR